jgi:predicted metal-dependent hydrolase
LAITFSKKTLFFAKIVGVVSEDWSKIVKYNDIGNVTFIRKDSVRNLKITIKPFIGVQVIFPRAVSLENAGKFVEEKRLWIKKNQLKLNKIEKRTTFFDENCNYSTREHLLVLERHEKSTIKTIIGKGKIIIMFPSFADVRDPRVQTAIRKAMVMAWKIEAKRFLPARVDYLARQHNLQYRRVTVRDNKSRWGSCSRDNRISLNIHLMRLPEYLCDYIILHELAHTVHRHHQKSFWDFLDLLTSGQCKKLDKEMLQYSPEIW